MTIFQDPPGKWRQDSELITPEKLNRNLLAAKQSVEDFARDRWRCFTIHTPLALSSDGVIAKLPSFTGFDYVVEYVSLYGTYSGDVTLTYGLSGAQTVLELPATANEFGYTVLPGVTVTGSDFSSIFEVKLSGGTYALRGVIGLRVARSTASPVMSTLFDTWQENEVLDAVKFNSQKTALANFASSFTSSTSIKPHSITRVTFNDFSSTTNTLHTTDRLPGSGPAIVRRIVGRVQMASSGNFGQSVTVSAGFGSLTTVATPSVAFLSEVWFSSGTLAQFDSVRDPATGTDDYFVRVTTNGAVSVARVELYIITQKI